MNFLAIGYSGGGPTEFQGYVIIAVAIICIVIAWINRKALAELHKGDKDKYKPKPLEGIAWKCPKCGEENEEQFDFCWKCKTPKVV